MTVYFILLAIPAIFSMLSPHRMRLGPMILYLLIAIVAVGLRDSVGMDWNNYLDLHRKLTNTTLATVIFDLEPLSNIIFWTSQQTGGGIYSSNVIEAIILIGGIVMFARRTPDPWLSIIAATPYLIVVVGFSATRQSMAAGVILMAFACWRSLSIPARVAFIVVASLFHVSALVMLAFVAFDLPIGSVVRFGLTGLIGLAAVGVAWTSDSMSSGISLYGENYVGEGSVDSPGAIAHLLLVWIPMLMYFAYREKLIPWLVQSSVILVCAWAALFLFVVALFSTIGASRLSIYLYMLPMAVYPAWVRAFDPYAETGRRLGIIALHVFILISWLAFANNSKAYMSYGNLLFSIF